MPSSSTHLALCPSHSLPLFSVPSLQFEVRDYDLTAFSQMSRDEIVQELRRSGSKHCRASTQG